MTDGFTDSFDRSGRILGSPPDKHFTELLPGGWEISNDAATSSSMSCNTCGNVVTLEPGESISYDDPRVCEHFQPPPGAATGLGKPGWVD